MDATKANQLDQVKALINRDVDVNLGGDDGRTALHEACTEGYFDIANVLILKGANVNARDDNGHTPLDDATQNNQPQIVELLKLHGGSYGDVDAIVGPFFKSVASGDTGEAGRLIESGVEVNSRDMNGRTPLHIAVAQGDAEMAKLLLSRQANPLAEDRHKITPMQEADRRRVRLGFDPMTKLFEPYRPKRERPISPFAIAIALIEIASIVLFGACTVYSVGAEGYDTVDALVDREVLKASFPMLIGLHFMVFVGFGFLHAFLRKNAYGSVGVAFLIAALAWQWWILMDGFWSNIFSGHGVPWAYIELNWRNLVLADFAAGSVLITYGALLGKVSPMQMSVLAVTQVFFYTINYHIMRTLVVTDIGGSMFIALFSAWFAWGTTLCLTPAHAMASARNHSAYVSDLFSILGTLFLWVFWPCWNSALGVDVSRYRILTNTLLSLMGSCVAAFIMSHAVRKEKFAMVDIQYATIAGGVAIGACADLLIGPGPALAIGFIAGCCSVVGYALFQGYWEEYARLHDTAGVMHLFGAPGFIGGIASAIAVGVIPTTEYSLGALHAIMPAVQVGRQLKTQALLQFAFVWISIAVGFASGCLSSLLVMCSFYDPPLEERDCYSDDQFWHVPRKEEAFYFDEKAALLHRITVDGPLREGALAGEKKPLLPPSKYPMGRHMEEEAALRADIAPTSPPSPRSEAAALDLAQQLESTVSKLTLRIAALERNSPGS